MSTIVRNNAKGLAVVLSAAMVLSATAFPTSDAKAKKPKLSKTKVSVEVGKKVKVTVKNAKKVTWTLPKAAKKIVALKKKSKKGATIVGKAVGKAKIKVTMKGKKKVKKTLTVTVTEAKTTTNKGNTGSATPTPTANSGQQQATPTPTAVPSTEPTEEPTPTPPEGYKRMEVDIKQAMTNAGEDAQKIPYNEEKGCLTVKDLSLFVLPLPEELPYGSEVNVYVTGNQNAEPSDPEADITEAGGHDNGFRCYLIPGTDNALCSTIPMSWDPATWSPDGEGTGDPVATGIGPFQWNFSLAFDMEGYEEENATHIQFKAHAYNGSIADLEISKIIIEWKNAPAVAQ